MALDRQKLRDDLVAVIHAGREISPEHDYALAEVFLRHARESLIQEVAPPARPITGGQLGGLLAVACFAVAGLLSPFFLFHDYHHAGDFGQQNVAPSPYDNRDFGPPGWWGGR